MFELDADVFKIDVSAAQSELDEARARLSLAADEAARQAQLMEHNATPVARAKQTAIEVEIARAAVARKQSALARAELALSHTRVVAPISGTVGRPHVAPGAFVDAKADTVLAEIAQLDPILVACYVSYHMSIENAFSNKPGRPRCRNCSGELQSHSSCRPAGPMSTRACRSSKVPKSIEPRTC